MNPNFLDRLLDFIGEPAGTRTQDHLIKSRVGYVVTSDREASLDRKFS
jgi:hypothetical protein